YPGHPRGETPAPPGREVGIAGTVSVGNTRTDLLNRNAQLLCHHERLRHAGPADVGVPGDDRGASIAVPQNRGARGHPAVEPEPAGAAPGLIRFEHGAPRGRRARRLETLLQADWSVRRTVRS